MKKYNEMTVPERQAALRDGQLNLTCMVDEALQMLEAKSRLNVCITATPEVAREQAAAVTARIAGGEMPTLAGVILAVKDNIALKGVGLTCASNILRGYVTPYSATAVKRLTDAGAVVLFKSNLDEFAMGSSNETSAWGAVLNPFDEARVPGGSSGGSAAAVAAGIVTAALGSETGGSVRQPAAFCGVVGVKPTYGRVSRYGLVAFGSSLDSIGVMARTADEAARVFMVMAGVDDCDNTSSPVQVPDCTRDVSLKGLRVGLPEEYQGKGLETRVRQAVERSAEVLADSGAVVSRCSLPHTKYSIPTYYIIAPAEASSNLARYDGVRYGPRVTGDDDNIIRLSRQAGFGAEVKRRILLGTYVLSSGYYDAYYLKAQRVRRLIRAEMMQAFERFDLLLTPTTPTTAFRLGEKSGDPLAMYLSDIFTAPANLAGVPAVSVPFGFDDRGLPVGVQLMAADFREDLLFGVAGALEVAR